MSRRFERSVIFLYFMMLISYYGYAQTYRGKFNGTSSYVDLGFNITNYGVRSITFNFIPTNTIDGSGHDGYTFIARNDPSQYKEYGVYIRGADWINAGNLGKLSFWYRDNGVLHEIMSNQNTWQGGTCYHVAGIIDPEQGMKLYINGVLQTQSDPGGLGPVLVDISYRTTIGCWGDYYGRYFDGTMKNLAVWNSALSVSDIQNTINGVFNPNDPKLIALYKFEEGSGTVLNDASPNALNGIVHYMTWVNYSALPTPSSISGPAIICSGAQATFSVSSVPGASGYIWSLPNGWTGTSSSNTILVSSSQNSGTITAAARNDCGISSPATLAIQINPTPTLSVSANSVSICSGDNAILSVSGASAYSWSNGTNSSSVAVSPIMTNVYTVTGTTNGCSSQQTIQISVTPTPTLSVNSPFICSGTASLTASGATSYSWLPGNSTNSNIVVSPTVTNNYTVIGANGLCTNSAVSTVSVGYAPPWIINSSSLSACSNKCLQFSTSALFNAYTYYWGDSSLTQQLMSSHCYTSAGVYTVFASATYTSGCSVLSANVITLTIFPLPIPEFSISATELIKNEPINFTNYSLRSQLFQWSFGDSTKERNHQLTDNISHTYTSSGKKCILLIALDTLRGCRDSVQKCIDVLCKTSINIPTVFTPNNDDVNDVFIFKNDCIQSLSCTIYNRWGTKIYEWSGPGGWWDGRTDSGEEVSPGVYYFIMEYIDENGSSIRKKGNISLFR